MFVISINKKNNQYGSEKILFIEIIRRFFNAINPQSNILRKNKSIDEEQEYFMCKELRPIWTIYSSNIELYDKYTKKIIIGIIYPSIQ